MSIATGLLGAHEVVVPLTGSQLRDGELVLAYDKDTIADAPVVSAWQSMSSADTAQLAAYYCNQAPAAAGNATASGTADMRGEDVVEVTRSEELLHVGVQRVASQVVRVSKYIVTETVTRTFQLSHEEIRVDTFPATATPGDPAGALPAAGERSLEIVLHAQQLVVTTAVVPVERAGSPWTPSPTPCTSARACARNTSR